MDYPSPFGDDDDARREEREPSREPRYDRQQDHQDQQPYFDERKMLIQASQDQSQYFDKGILTLSAGALGLSLTFIKDITPNVGQDTKFWLIFSWIFYTVSLLTTLCSFLCSIEALTKQVSILDSGDDTRNIWGYWTKQLNWCSMCCFVFATLFLVVFVSLNIEVAEMAKPPGDQSITQDGWAPLPPSRPATQAPPVKKEYPPPPPPPPPVKK